MDNGFRALLGGVLLAALIFALLSVVPGISAMTKSAAVLNSAPAQPAALALQNNHATSGNAASAATGGAANGAASATPATTPAKEYVFLQEEEDKPPRRWLYANGNVMLRKEPQGAPFIPLSASFAPLTIHSGTRLWPVRTEEEWLLVQSPGKTLGWVHKDEVFTDDNGQSGSYYDIPPPRRPWVQ